MKLWRALLNSIPRYRHYKIIAHYRDPYTKKQTSLRLHYKGWIMLSEEGSLDIVTINQINDWLKIIMASYPDFQGDLTHSNPWLTLKADQFEIWLDDRVITVTLDDAANVIEYRHRMFKTPYD